MDHTEQILDFSTIIVTTVSFAFALTRGIPAYAAIFSERKYGYKFDKSRLPLSIYTVILLAIVSFLYCLIVSGDIAAAVIYGVMMTLFGGIGSVIFITFRPTM